MGARLFSADDWAKLAKQADYQPAQLATLCGISLRQLERNFEREFHKTPTVWLRELRCAEILSRLSKGERSKALASEFKFSDGSHLCHEFKKVYASSPRKLAFRLKAAVGLGPPLGTATDGYGQQMSLLDNLSDL